MRTSRASCSLPQHLPHSLFSSLLEALMHDSLFIGDSAALIGWLEQVGANQWHQKDSLAECLTEQSPIDLLQTMSRHHLPLPQLGSHTASIEVLERQKLLWKNNCSWWLRVLWSVPNSSHQATPFWEMDSLTLSELELVVLCALGRNLLSHLHVASFQKMFEKRKETENDVVYISTNRSGRCLFFFAALAWREHHMTPGPHSFKYQSLCDWSHWKTLTRRERKTPKHLWTSGVI